MSILEETQTRLGKLVKLYEMPYEKGDKTILFIGVFHGDEPQGKYLIEKFAKEKMQKCKNKVIYIPCLNPDGMELGTRQNSNGVDLNRNFPTKNFKVTTDKQYYGGKNSSSEEETKFLIKILEEYKPDVILTIHAPYKIVNYDGPAIEIAKRISEITGYPVEGDIGYETLGSFGTYAGKERQIPTITLELPEDIAVEKLWLNIQKVFNYLSDEL
jgi:protein MpaA